MNEHDPMNDAELDTLLAALQPEEREALLEEHRQLEKDLLRLSDPLPPADFVQQVMHKVATAPAPAPAAKDVALAVVITFGAMAAGLAAFLTHGAGISGLGLSFANGFLQVRHVLAGLGSGFEAVWHTAAVPVALALAAMLLTSFAALKKIGTEVKVAS
ncbi:MAG: hypothetical protein IPJ65_41860 [Archangiaceae bacterium]|nr:hypothetical protein [Archangiaceae bacterium]